MAVELALTSRLDRWESRLEKAIDIVPYVALGMSALITVLTYPATSTLPLSVTLTLSGVAAVWMLVLLNLRPAWRQRTVLMAVYYVGLIALIAALVIATPLYGFFAFTGYLHAVPALRGWWRMAGIAVTAMFSALARSAGTRPCSPRAGSCST